MSLLNRRYMIKVVCGNCGKNCEVTIKKGTTVIEALKAKEIKCDNCGCEIRPKEYTTTWLK